MKRKCASVRAISYPPLPAQRYRLASDNHKNKVLPVKDGRAERYGTTEQEPGPHMADCQVLYLLSAKPALAGLCYLPLSTPVQLIHTPFFLHFVLVRIARIYCCLLGTVLSNLFSLSHLIFSTTLLKDNGVFFPIYIYNNIIHSSNNSLTPFGFLDPILVCVCGRRSFHT